MRVARAAQQRHAWDDAPGQLQGAALACAVRIEGTHTCHTGFTVCKDEEKDGGGGLRQALIQARPGLAQAPAPDPGIESKHRKCSAKPSHGQKSTIATRTSIQGRVSPCALAYALHSALSNECAQPGSTRLCQPVCLCLHVHVQRSSNYRPCMKAALSTAA